jgi:lipopolysaccharide transport system permease protein
LNKRTVIEPGGKSKNYWKDLWDYRSLFYFLAWRDVLVRYKQTAIGIAWSVIRPLLTIAIMTGIGWLLKAPIPNGVPRFLYVCAATLPWQFFANIFAEASNSLVTNSNLLTKVYFPRLIIPLSSVIVCLIDFFISCAILIVAMVIFRYTPDWKIVLLPFFMILTLLTAGGVGLLIASLNVKYRDFKYVIPFILQFGVYVSPIAYSSDSIYNSTSIPQIAKLLYSANPMVGVIDGFRWAILGGDINIYMPGFLISIGISIFFLILGIWNFRKTEHSFADII